MAAPDRLYFTDDDEACRLLAADPFALLVGFVLDQQVPVPKAFFGPLELQRRLGSLDAERIANDGAYLQFLRERNMSVGLYALGAGAQDMQSPHREDELYVVISGRASLTVGEATIAVGGRSVG